MPNIPQDRGETWQTPDGSDEDLDRERRQHVPEKRNPEVEEDENDPRDDREREGIQVRPRIDPTRYVL
ncbi:MAG TPA: hypothetical protein VGS22_14565 [Thermoanaerobaculia bacterium]|nr:hypothetical protein [Thermoanaerobaculia bacterium]